MIRFHHHSNVLNHIKIIFLCSCCSSLGSPDIAQETGAKLHFSIAFSIERSRNVACFCAFSRLIFEIQSIFGHNTNRLSYSCGLLIAFFQILWAIIRWKTFLVSFFSGHWNFTGWLTSDVIMAKIIGRAIASLRKQSWPLPPGNNRISGDPAHPGSLYSRPQSLRMNGARFHTFFTGYSTVFHYPNKKEERNLSMRTSGVEHGKFYSRYRHSLTTTQSECWLPKTWIFYVYILQA